MNEYVLVPRKITEAMCDAYNNTPCGFAGSPPHAQHVWDAMLAAAPTPAADDAWLPIESAPKDGSRILMAYPCGAVKFGFYLDNSATSHPWAGWRVTSGELTPKGQPTHWQPLPAPPAIANERGEG